MEHTNQKIKKKMVELKDQAIRSGPSPVRIPERGRERRGRQGPLGGRKKKKKS